MVKVLTFDTTGEAYDACQCDDTIKDGDVLIIRNEPVVGLAWTWPVAVTPERGNLHSLLDGSSLDQIKDHDGNRVFSDESIALAMQCAREAHLIKGE